MARSVRSRKPIRAWGLAAGFLLLSLFSAGCLTGQPEPVSPAVTTVSFDADGFGSAAELERIGEGEAIGPDLVLHAAELYRLEQAIPIQGEMVTRNWTIGVDPEHGRMLSAYADCGHLVPVPRDGLVCRGGELWLSISDQTLFFGAPLVLPHIPDDRAGAFTVPVIDAGRLVEVPFHAREDGGTLVVTSQRRVEHGYLDRPGTSGGWLLECDVFEDDALVIKEGRVGCRESGKAWTWWVDRPLPWGFETLPRERTWDHEPVLEPVVSSHLQPLGTSGFDYPFDQAFADARAGSMNLRQTLEDPTWRIQGATHDWASFNKAGPLTCTTFSWNITAATASGRAATVETRRQTCSEGISGPPEIVEDRREDGVAWPEDPSIIPLPEAAAITAKVLCWGSEEIEHGWHARYVHYTRPVTGENRTWLYTYLDPDELRGSRTTGFNFTLVDQSSGYPSMVRYGGDPRVLETVFEDGLHRRCP